MDTLLPPTPLPIFPTFPERLQYARQRARLLQRDAALAIGVSEDTIGHWERGRREPRARQIQSLSVAYGVPPGWLLGDAPSPAEPRVTTPAPAHPHDPRGISHGDRGALAS